MNNKSQRSAMHLFIPFRIITGIVLGVVVVLFTYIYCNVAVAATVQTTSASSLHAREDQDHWQPLDTHAHVIFYRIDDNASSSSKHVLNIFVNNQYHSSILSHSRAVELLLCPGKKKVDVSISQLDQHYYSRPETVGVVSPTLQAGERYYYQVALNDQGQITASWVPQKVAEAALVGIKPQLRTLSRVVNERTCPEVTYSIDTTKVFTHHSNSTTISTVGNSALTKLMGTITHEFKEIDKVVVKNASDINEKVTITHPLSQMRANSVATWLVNSDLASPQFIAQGKDINNCAASTFSQADQKNCLDFKRSVDIEVYGVKKNQSTSL